MEHEQESLMERSGLGLLPGIAVAFVLALCVLAAVLIDEWWPFVFLAITLVVVVVVLAVMEDEDDEHLRPHVPGL